MDRLTSSRRLSGGKLQAKGMGLLLLALILIGACSPFSQSLRREADPSIVFKDVLKAPERFTGRTVLWGGIIIETQNRKGETLIQVLQTELDASDQPENPDVSSGRFIIRHEGFLDPAVYSKGRQITAIGTIVGKEDKPIGDLHYVYPVIKAKALKLWERPVRARHPYPYWPYPQFWEPTPWPPYWWWY